MMTRDLLALGPMLITAGGAVVLLLALAVCRSHAFASAWSVLVLAAALAAIPMTWPGAPASGDLLNLLAIDSWALAFWGIIFGSALVVCLLGFEYFRPLAVQAEEFYVLVLLSATGAAVLAAADHFATVFLGLELLSVSLFALAAYRRDQAISIEAGIKYLVLAGTSSALLLFGLALLYFHTASLRLSGLAGPLLAGHPDTIALYAGIALVLVAMGFKLGLAPMHVWTPDVYQGSPAPVSALVGSVSKAGAMAFMVRLAGVTLTGTPGVRNGVFYGLLVLAIASMFTGNLLALRQPNIKRLLAYSSIAHMGYCLLAVLPMAAGAALDRQAVFYYMLAHAVSILGAFGCVCAASENGREAQHVEDYRGLAWRRPVLAGVFSLMLLSLAGIPLTAGFLGKFYVLASGVRNALWLPAVCLVINSGIGLFYYLRVLGTLYQREEAESPDQFATSTAPSALLQPSPQLLLTHLTLAALVVLLIYFGLMPALASLPM